MDTEHLKASLTVEAAAVIGIVLLTIGSMILVCFRLHDKVAAKNNLRYSIELFSHRNPDSPYADRYEKAAENTEVYLIGGEKVKLEKGLTENSLTGSVTVGGTEIQLKNTHLRGEEWLRMSTLEDFRNLPQEKRKNGGQE